MTRRRRSLLSWFVAGFLVTTMGMAAGQSPALLFSQVEEQKAGNKSETPAAADKKSASGARGMLKFPGDAIFVIGKEIKDALSLSPEMYLLRKEEYAALKAQIAELKRLVNPGKPVPPSSCQLTGQVDGDLVHLQVRFDFTTTEPRTLVALGCQRAWPTAASMDDGKLPLLLPAAEDGWTVQVDSPGAHSLTLDVELPATMKEGEVGFNLGLPRAPITNLEQLTLNEPVPEVRLYTSGARSPGRTVTTKPADSQHSRLAAIGLGHAERLQVLWKSLAPKPQQGPPLLTSEGILKVQVEEARVITDVELNLQVRRGQTQQWQIQVPPQATLDVKEPANDRVKSIKYPTPQDPILAFELKEPSSESLKVNFQVRQAWTDSPFAVGPFGLVNAFRQWGTIRIAEPADVRLRYHLHGDVTQREIKGDRGRDNVTTEFSYWNLNASPGQPLQPPLEIEKLKGTVESNVEHELRLTERGWQIISKFTVTPVRSSIERVELNIDPALYDPEVGASSPNGLVEEVSLDAPHHLASVKIQKQNRPLILIWPGLYRLSQEQRQQGGQLNVELPGCLQTLDRGGQITAILPFEGWTLVSAKSFTEGFRPGDREYTWRSDRAPQRAEFAWRPYRPELIVDSVADLVLAGNQARVQQRFDFRLSQGSLGQFRFVIPSSLKNRIRLGTKEAKWESDGTVVLTKPVEKEGSVTLEYSFPLLEIGEAQPDRRLTVNVPLVQVEQATRSETRIRIWTEPGIQAALVKGAWEERPTELVAGQDRVPTLVLRSLGSDSSLRLQLMDVAANRSTDVLIDRTLIQMALGEDQVQSYRARFLVSRINVRYLDIQLPVSSTRSLVPVLLGGKRLPVLSAEGGMVRLAVEPELFRKPVLLEVNYHFISEGGNGNGILPIRLYPPRLRQAVFLGPVRWQVAYPPSRISCFQSGGLVGDQRWVWQGGMLAPRPALSTADLERWLTGTATPPVRGVELATAEPELEPSLVCYQASAEPLFLLQVSRQIWLLACSLLFLIVGLVLALSRIPRAVFWLLVAALGLAGAGVGIYWPGLLTAIIYGCEPGIVIFGFVMAIQWMLQERYRRRVVFLPGFTRLERQSSRVRSGSGDRSRIEPSTVDAPPPTPSGIRQPAAEVKGQ